MKDPESKYRLLFVLFINCAATQAQPIELEPKSCASIFLENSVEADVELFQNTTVDRTQFNKIQFNGKIRNARFEIGQNFNDSDTCQLEVCGFSKSQRRPGMCSRFQGITRAPGDIFWSDFEVTSIACSCNPNPDDNCDSSTCSSKNESRTWKDTECAFLFEEENCQNCYFQPRILYNNSNINSSNSFQIKRAIVRPGCLAIQEFKGQFQYDFLEGTSNLTANGTEVIPAFNKQGENFNCTCSFSLEDKVAIKPEPTEKNKRIWLWIGFTSGGLALAAFLIFFARYLITKRYNSNGSEKEPSDTLKNDTPSEISGSNTESQGSVVTVLNSDNGVVLPNHNPSSSAHNLGPFHRDSYQFTQEVYTQFRAVCHTVVRLEDFDITKDLAKPIGQGVSGIVYKGEFTKTKQNVAVKKYILQRNHHMLIDSFFREIKTFQKIGQGHIHIVRYYGACCHEDELYLLTEYCEGGSLRQYLFNELRPKYEKLETPCQFQDWRKKLPGTDYFIVDHNAAQACINKANKSRALSKEHLQLLLSWCEQIASGMQFLAARGIIHGDLAARNILLSSHGMVKICDLGMAKRCLKDQSGALSLIAGNFPVNSYAPELIRAGMNGGSAMKMTLYVDRWAYGCTLWEMFTLGGNLYPGMEIAAIPQAILDNYRNPPPVLAPDDVYAIMLNCWNEKAKKRPNFDSLFEYFNRRDILMLEDESMITSSESF